MKKLTSAFDDSCIVDIHATIQKSLDFPCENYGDLDQSDLEATEFF